MHLAHKYAKLIALARFGCIQTKAGRMKTLYVYNTHMKCCLLCTNNATYISQYTRKLCYLVPVHETFARVAPSTKINHESNPQ